MYPEPRARYVREFTHFVVVMWTIELWEGESGRRVTQSRLQERLERPKYRGTGGKNREDRMRWRLKELSEMLA